MASRGTWSSLPKNRALSRIVSPVNDLDPRAAAQRRTRLVKGDVPVAADPQDLQIDAARVLDHLFVALATGLEVRRPAVGHMRLGGDKVQVLEQILLHEVAVALRMVLRQADVFIQVEGGDLGKVEPFFAMQANQFPIHAQGRSARGKSQHASGLPADQIRHETSRPARSPPSRFYPHRCFSIKLPLQSGLRSIGRSRSEGAVTLTS